MLKRVRILHFSSHHWFSLRTCNTHTHCGERERITAREMGNELLFLPGLPLPLWNHFWYWTSFWSPLGFCLWSCSQPSCRSHLANLWCPSNLQPKQKTRDESEQMDIDKMKRRPSCGQQTQRCSNLTHICMKDHASYILDTARNISIGTTCITWLNRHHRFQISQFSYTKLKNAEKEAFPNVSGLL